MYTLIGGFDSRPCSQEVKFSAEEISQLKRVSTTQLCLLGFKPLSCLKDYHNLKPSTFLFPTDEVDFCLCRL